MDVKTAIEVQRYGDFDIVNTECIMVHPKKINKSELLKEFYRLAGITSQEGLSYSKLETINKDFIAFLELKGFKKLRTYEVLFSD